MLKVLPEAHSSDQSATNLSGGKIKRNKDLDDLARRIKKLPNAPPPRESRAKFIVEAASFFASGLLTVSASTSLLAGRRCFGYPFT